MKSFQLDHIAVIIFTCRSPLMIAADNGHITILQLLLQFDADTTLKDTKGWSCEDYAMMKGQHA